MNSTYIIFNGGQNEVFVYFVPTCSLPPHGNIHLPSPIIIWEHHKEKLSVFSCPHFVNFYYLHFLQNNGSHI